LNTSIHNNIAISVIHIYREYDIIAKSIYHAMNITFIETELFAIRYSISLATQLQNIRKIIVITNAILVAKQIFDLSVYPYQLHSITISSNLRGFFNEDLS